MSNQSDGLIKNDLINGYQIKRYFIDTYDYTSLYIYNESEHKNLF